MTHEIDPYKYHARPVKVIDGDTIDVVFDIGFNVTLEQRVRLAGIDTAEIYGVKKGSEEYERGIVHKTFVSEWLGEADAEYDGEYPLYVDTERGVGKYGRYIATIQRRSDDRYLDRALVREFGAEVEYDADD